MCTPPRRERDLMRVGTPQAAVAAAGTVAAAAAAAAISMTDSIFGEMKACMSMHPHAHAHRRQLQQQQRWCGGSRRVSSPWVTVHRKKTLVVGV